jgi:hypothetical protein
MACFGFMQQHRSGYKFRGTLADETFGRVDIDRDGWFEESMCLSQEKNPDSLIFKKEPSYMQAHTARLLRILSCKTSTTYAIHSCL